MTTCIDNGPVDIWRDCPVSAKGGVLICEVEADDVMFVRYGRGEEVTSNQ